jgi:hypothetical protein
MTETILRSIQQIMISISVMEINIIDQGLVCLLTQIYRPAALI